MAEPIVLPGSPRLQPLDSLSDDIAAALSGSSNRAVAVGSGTLNDIVKLASHRSDRSYMLVATAASVDGYASFGASMLAEGWKQTIPCPAGRVLLADPDVLASAPKQMAASGYADLLGKLTAGADWIIAEELGIEEIDAEIWAMVQTELREWIDHPAAIRRGDVAAISELFAGLTMSALAMQAYRDTRPASGTEHLLSHTWEMEHLEYEGEPVSHGFKVGIGTLAAAALLEVLFDSSIDSDVVARAVRRRLSIEDRESQIQNAFGAKRFTRSLIATGVAKHDRGESHARRIRRAADRWESLGARLKGQVPPFDELRRLLESAGCPVTPKEIGVTNARLANTYRKAQMVRKRYTSLDLAFDLNILDSSIETIFASGRYF